MPNFYQDVIQPDPRFESVKRMTTSTSWNQ